MQHAARTGADLRAQLRDFFRRHIEPNEAAVRAEALDNRKRGRPFATLQGIERLKVLARGEGLWNLFLPRSAHAPDRLSNLDYAPLCEIMGHVAWSSEVFNCSAPDTGNMELLEHFGSEAQKRAWLEPLLAGEIRSAFLMTEPDVACSDATNVMCRIEPSGADYVINGSKWWSTGAHDARCKLLIVMGKTGPSAPAHGQQSMIVVPADAPGVTVERDLTVFGYDDAPQGHAQVRLENVRVSRDHVLLGEGRGFEMAQARLGPGRVHHCMRSIGAAERALRLMCQRLDARVAFGKRISEQSVWHERIAEARCAIDQARLLVLETARRMDEVGNRQARKQIAMIKVVVPSVALRVIDWAIQAHGGAGLCDDVPLAEMYAGQRALRIVDGPDEVHRQTIAKLELELQLACAAQG
jgi:acyl-CoA dehydrogenase